MVFQVGVASFLTGAAQLSAAVSAGPAVLTAMESGRAATAYTLVRTRLQRRGIDVDRLPENPKAAAHELRRIGSGTGSIPQTIFEEATAAVRLELRELFATPVIDFATVTPRLRPSFTEGARFAQLSTGGAFDVVPSGWEPAPLMDRDGLEAAMGLGRFSFGDFLGDLHRLTQGRLERQKALNRTLGKDLVYDIATLDTLARRVDSALPMRGVLVTLKEGGFGWSVAPIEAVADNMILEGEAIVWDGWIGYDERLGQIVIYEEEGAGIGPGDREPITAERVRNMLGVKRAIASIIGEDLVVFEGSEMDIRVREAELTEQNGGVPVHIITNRQKLEDSIEAIGDSHVAYLVVERVVGRVGTTEVRMSHKKSEQRNMLLGEERVIGGGRSHHDISAREMRIEYLRVEHPFSSEEAGLRGEIGLIDPDQPSLPRATFTGFIIAHAIFERILGPEIAILNHRGLEINALRAREEILSEEAGGYRIYEIEDEEAMRVLPEWYTTYVVVESRDGIEIFRVGPDDILDTTMIMPGQGERIVGAGVVRYDRVLRLLGVNGDSPNFKTVKNDVEVGSSTENLATLAEGAGSDGLIAERAGLNNVSRVLHFIFKDDATIVVAESANEPVDRLIDTAVARQ